MPLNSDFYSDSYNEEVSHFKNLTKNWEDPNPDPVIELHQGIHVVRDDLLEAGSKQRFADLLIKSKEDVTEWVYGSSPRWGYGQVSLAYLCKKYNKQCTLFLAKSNAFHRNTQKAINYGATVHQIVGGLMNICQTEAKNYIKNHKNMQMLPSGLDHELVAASIFKVAKNIDIKPDYVVTVAGSGVLNRGLQMVWPDAQFTMVQVGHKLTLDESGNASVIVYPKEFKIPCPEIDKPPFPSVVEYDAKAWKYAVELKQKVKKEKVLFWNVAA